MGIDANGFATEIAITLLRATGVLSQGPMATRPLPAGPRLPLEGPQLQRTLALRWGFAVTDTAALGGGSPAGDIDGYRLVDDAFLPLFATAGGPGGTRPREGQALAVTGAEVSAVRRTPAGELEVRVFNPTAATATCALPRRQGWVVDLRGRRQRPWSDSVELRPWEIATLVLS